MIFWKKRGGSPFLATYLNGFLWEFHWVNGDQKTSRMATITALTQRPQKFCCCFCRAGPYREGQKSLIAPLHAKKSLGNGGFNKIFTSSRDSRFSMYRRSNGHFRGKRKNGFSCRAFQLCPQSPSFQGGFKRPPSNGSAYSRRTNFQHAISTSFLVVRILRPNTFLQLTPLP